jgi:hypothetical protein
LKKGTQTLLIIPILVTSQLHLLIEIKEKSMSSQRESMCDSQEMAAEIEMGNSAVQEIVESLGCWKFCA